MVQAYCVKCRAKREIKDPKLRVLYTKGRERLVNQRDGDPDGWIEMKKLTKKNAHGAIPVIDEQDLIDRNDILILLLLVCSLLP